MTSLHSNFPNHTLYSRYAAWPINIGVNVAFKTTYAHSFSTQPDFAGGLLATPTTRNDQFMYRAAILAFQKLNLSMSIILEERKTFKFEIKKTMSTPFAGASIVFNGQPQPLKETALENVFKSRLNKWLIEKEQYTLVYLLLAKEALFPSCFLLYLVYSLVLS